MHAKLAPRRRAFLPESPALIGHDLRADVRPSELKNPNPRHDHHKIPSPRCNHTIPTIHLLILKMASRPAARLLRQSARQLAVPAVQRRTFVSALNVARAGVAAAPKAVSAPMQQVRGIKTIDFAGTKETVYGGLSCFCMRNSVLTDYRA